MRSKTPEYRAAYWRKWSDSRFAASPRPCLTCDGTIAWPSRQRRCNGCLAKLCEHCRQPFRLSEGKRTQRFCSLRCKALGDTEAIVRINTHRGRKPRTYARQRGKHGSAEDREWRLAVFTRDNFTCRNCGARGRIEADHIKPYSAHPELRHDLENGRTLCVPCHRRTPTYGYGAYRYAKRLRQEVLAL